MAMVARRTLLRASSEGGAPRGRAFAMARTVDGVDDGRVERGGGWVVAREEGVGAWQDGEGSYLCD